MKTYSVKDDSAAKIIEFIKLNLPLKIKVNLKNITSQLSEVLAEASYIKYFSPKDINITLYFPPEIAPEDRLLDTANTDSDFLVKKGNPILDVLLFNTLKEDPVLLNLMVVKIAEDDGTERQNIGELSYNVLFCYFFYLITQGSFYPSTKFIPSYLSTHYGLKNENDLINYAGILSSFDVSKLDNTWIKDIRINTFSPQSQSRFIMGLAGNRIVSAIASHEPDKDISNTIKESYNIVYSLGLLCPSWDLHPLFRSKIDNICSSFNAALLGLIKTCYKDDTIENLIRDKYIPVQAKGRTTNREWAKWNRTTFNDIKGGFDSSKNYIYIEKLKINP